MRGTPTQEEEDTFNRGVEITVSYFMAAYKREGRDISKVFTPDLLRLGIVDSGSYLPGLWRMCPRVLHSGNINKIVLSIPCRIDPGPGAGR